MCTVDITNIISKTYQLKNLPMIVIQAKLSEVNLQQSVDIVVTSSEWRATLS